MTKIEFQIESGVPVPPRPVSAVLYPFASMKPGDSFRVGNDKQACVRVRTAVQFFRKNNPGSAFAVRRTDDGYRCWRLA